MTKIIEDVRQDIGVIDESFDSDILIYINVAITDLRMVGATNATSVGKDDDWSKVGDVFSDTQGSIRSYISTKTKYMFDPPQPSMVGQMGTIIDHSLFRIQQSVELQEYDKGGD